MTTTKTEKSKRAPKAKAAGEETKPKRRTAEQRIADLEAEIAAVRQREATKELRQDPAVKLTAAAVRTVNKALGEAEEPELVEALEGAKALLAGYLESKGLRVPKPGKKRGAAKQAAA